MAYVIVLADEQATEIRGPSAVDPQCAIMPIALTDGRFFVGVEILDDPAHAAHHDMLADLPMVDYETITGLLPQPPEE